MQANQTSGRGFFTAPSRTARASLVRQVSGTFADHWSQPRLFYNSLTPVERQFLVNAIRFETGNLKSESVKTRVLAQLNKVSNEVAKRVAEALGMEAPSPEPRYYHSNVTAGISIINSTLPTIATLKVGVLSSIKSLVSLQQAATIKKLFAAEDVAVSVIGEALTSDVDTPYAAADASAFDGIIVTAGAEILLNSKLSSPLYPVGRPMQILVDGYRWGKPLAAIGLSSSTLTAIGIPITSGVYVRQDVDSTIRDFKSGLKKFKFVDRFPIDIGYEK
jgi:catalase